MSADLSLEGLLQGSLGALLTAVAAIGAAYVLVRHERSLRLEDRAAERDRDELSRREAIAWDLVGAAQLLTIEVSTPRFAAGPARVQLLAAAAKFEAGTRLTSPVVATWATESAVSAVRAYGRYVRYKFLPGSRRRRKLVLEACAPLLAVLPLWISMGSATDVLPTLLVNVPNGLDGSESEHTSD